MITIVVNGNDAVETANRVYTVTMALPHLFKAIGCLYGNILEDHSHCTEHTVKWQSDNRAFITMIEDEYSVKVSRLIHIMLPYVDVVEGTETATIENKDVP